MSSYQYTRAKDKEEDDKKGQNFISASFIAIFVIWMANAWWPEILADLPTWGRPFWHSRGDVGLWVTDVWPVFVWAITATLGLCLFKPAAILDKFSSSDILGYGTLASLFAGVFEELAFRWLIYLSAIAYLVFFNWLWGTVFLFVFAGLLGILLTLAAAKIWDKDDLPAVLVGIVCALGVICLVIFGRQPDLVKWFYNALLIPLADWTSFHKLHDLFYATGATPGVDTWAIGAGIVSANTFFRDGHKYLGFIGVVNSWYLGLILFWVMLTYGVWPAIVVHFLYDFLIFATLAAVRLLRS